MTTLPNFRAFCQDACIKAWGKPDRKTKNQLRWGDDSYNCKTFDLRKRRWYDAGAKVGGSTLELVAHVRGKKPGKLRGAAFFEAWNYAYEQKWVPDPPPQMNGGGKTIIATYPYNDEQGALLFEVVRFDTNDVNERFCQRRPDGNGGWIWKVKGTRQVLYRLPQLIEAVKAGQRVLVCEGERDANTAVRLGYAATTNSGGVKKWKKDYDDFFRGADVVVVSDNDANGEGQAHAGSVARRLSRVAKRVRTIIFPVKDLSQWAEASGTREQLDALIETAPEESGTALHADSEVISGGLEDTIALAFAEKHAADLRYVAIWNRWMQYNGAHWEVEQTLGAFDEARKLCRQAEDADAKTVAAVIALARSDRRLAATADQWDADAWLLGTTTGTIDLRTGKLRPASPEDTSPKSLTWRQAVIAPYGSNSCVASPARMWSYKTFCSACVATPSQATLAKMRCSFSMARAPTAKACFSGPSLGSLGSTTRPRRWKCSRCQIPIDTRPTLQCSRRSARHRNRNRGRQALGRSQDQNAHRRRPHPRAFHEARFFRVHAAIQVDDCRQSPPRYSHRRRGDPSAHEFGPVHCDHSERRTRSQARRQAQG
jgi:D5 N terminal like